MKRSVVSILVAWLWLCTAVIPAGAVSASDIDKINQRISSIEMQIAEQQKITSPYVDDAVTLILAEVISTYPQYIVKGSGWGISSFLNNIQYFVITDPSSGESENFYGLFSGTFLASGITQIQDGYYTHSAQILDPMPSVYRTASKKISELNKELESLKEQKSNLEKQLAEEKRNLEKKLEEQRKTPPDWAKETVQTAISKGYVPQSLQIDYGKAITRQEFCQLLVRTINAEFADDANETGYLAGVSSQGNEKVQFDDTSDKAVLLLAQEGIINGSGNGKFSPTQSLTRQQAATILARTINRLGIIVQTGTPSNYADSNRIASYALESVKYLSACESNGAKIMGGVGNDSFSPNGTYTRAQAIVTVCRLIDYVTDEKVNQLQSDFEHQNAKNSPLYPYDLAYNPKGKVSFGDSSYDANAYATEDGVTVVLKMGYDGVYRLYVYWQDIENFIMISVDELTVEGNQARGTYTDTEGNTGTVIFEFGNVCYLTVTVEHVNSELYIAASRAPLALGLTVFEF